MTATSNVIVIGGGYAGVMAANRLTRRAGVRITLINAQPVFVERIRLHQLVAGTAAATVGFAKILSPRVRVVVGDVTTVDAAARTVTLATGATLGYDYLVYAAGSTGAAPPHAFCVASLAEAQRLRAAGPAAVTVAGAGPTGIETAAELAEQGRPVTLIGELGPYLHERGRRTVAATLTRLGVSLVDARVAAVGPATVELADGRVLPSPVTVWAAGFRVPDLATRSGLAVDPGGRLLTDETLTSVTSSRIVAAGDAAAPSGRPLRMSCQAAGPLGVAAADTVLARLAGADPRPFVAGFLGQCISLGRRSGIFQFARRDDRAVGAHVAGRAGAVLKEFVCRGTVWQLTLEARHPGAYRVPSWAGDPARARLLAAAQPA
ncbi:NAD(P)/FAD-dependent oxidoreductase [Paractinoplanes lichenicola]|uniref:FAD-dependent oxidoreductase n=1 Tax=Paractinoplanes lichenicola TaxID=2802976 RepID=A0ABS1VTL7_9ACTN|nr:FAD-dependent oxidoreductase [Actinoplanes lichenicola]MBL7257813.1 FAD-dependent oxidoreductase [Actinoplanes lichenicola]